MHERPTMGPATEILFDNNMPSAPKDTTLPIGPDISPDAIDPFWFCYEKRGYIVQYHGNHNFSCWQKDGSLCRFKLPEWAWNQITGFIEIFLDKSSTNIASSKIGILEKVSDPPEPTDDSFFDAFEKDLRIIIFKSIKRTNDQANIRDPTSNYHELLKENMKDEVKRILMSNDEGRNNGLVSPCNAIILVIALCHNNIQILSRLSMGLEFYIADYISKGVGKLHFVLPLFHAAIAKGTKSVAEDVATNPHRHSLYLLSKTLNNVSRKAEYSLPLMLAHLLGLLQYYSSDKYGYIIIYAAREELMLAYNKIHNKDSQLDISPLLDEAKDEDEDENEPSNNEPPSQSHFETIHDREHPLETNLMDDPQYKKNIGEVVIDEINKKIYIVNVITDYRYRPKEIAFMNLMEFQCNVKKWNLVARILKIQI